MLQKRRVHTARLLRLSLLKIVRGHRVTSHPRSHSDAPSILQALYLCDGRHRRRGAALFFDELEPAAPRMALPVPRRNHPYHRLESKHKNPSR